MRFLMMMVLMCVLASTGFAEDVAKEVNKTKVEKKDKAEVKPDDAIKADVDAGKQREKRGEDKVLQTMQGSIVVPPKKKAS